MTVESEVDASPASAGHGSSRRGSLRVYLGMAPGVGKTYRMLSEARRLRTAGADVVVAFVEADSPEATLELLNGLELVAPARLEHRGVVVEELDLDGVIRRNPDLAVVDALGHRNIPGSQHERRWQDVEAILDAGIDVLSACDVGHAESIADAVETITGSPIVDRIPDRVLRTAEEIELVDLSPRELRSRLARGEIYPADRSAELLDHMYTESNLAALREISLRYLTESLTERVEAGQSRGRPPMTSPERFLVVLDERLVTRDALRKAAALSGPAHATLAAVLIETPEARHMPAAARSRIQDNIRYASDLGAEIVRYAAAGLVDGLEHVVRSRRVTHLVLSHRRRSGLARLVGSSPAETLAERLPGLQIHIVTDGATPDTGARGTT